MDNVRTDSADASASSQTAQEFSPAHFVGLQFVRHEDEWFAFAQHLDIDPVQIGTLVDVLQAGAWKKANNWRLYLKMKTRRDYKRAYGPGEPRFDNGRRIYAKGDLLNATDLVVDTGEGVPMTNDEALDAFGAFTIDEDGVHGSPAPPDALDRKLRRACAEEAEQQVRARREHYLRDPKWFGAAIMAVVNQTSAATTAAGLDEAEKRVLAVQYLGVPRDPYLATIANEDERREAQAANRRIARKKDSLRVPFRQAARVSRWRLESERYRREAEEDGPPPTAQQPNGPSEPTTGGMTFDPSRDVSLHGFRQDNSTIREVPRRLGSFIDSRQTTGVGDKLVDRILAKFEGQRRPLRFGTGKGNKVEEKRPEMTP